MSAAEIIMQDSVITIDAGEFGTLLVAGGTAGIQGPAGTSWSTGAGAPAGGLGSVGDFYLDTDNGDVYEKTGASTWTLRDNLTGPQGPQGIQGDQGIQGIQGPQGDQGIQGIQGIQGLQGDAGFNLREIHLTIDNGGAVIGTGLLNTFLPIGTPATIVGWRLTGTPVGSIVLTVVKANGTIPTIAGDISGSEKPTLSTARYNSDTTLTTWTTSLVAGDILGVNVDSVTDITTCTLTLEIQNV